MRKLIATALTALSALGIGIAHEAGAFEHVRPPVHSRPEFRLPPFHLPSSVTVDAVEHDAASDRDVKTVLCFAYEQFYDPSTDSVQLPSEDGVLTSLAGRVLPTTAADRIQGVLERNETRLQSLSDGDLDEVFLSLAC
jgi:hypothetical protein